MAEKGISWRRDAEKALDEAARTGVNRERLRKFAQDYLAQRKSKRN